ncbi:hypothetical protein ACGFU4_21885 [Streptomyces sp. NPDC048511]|uniref:hypothetical protein n=1 Tax=Streptomyces sp. NPDC048511 TaxID=3365562 RepID=UPI00371E0B8A
MADHGVQLLLGDQRAHVPKSKGATVLAGGGRRPDLGPFFFEPTKTIAVERVVPVGTPDGVDPARYARLVSAGLKILKRLPGIK